MPSIYVEGKKRLTGKIKVQGSKNAVLPIIAASVLIDGKSVITNCPKINDVETSIKILEQLGVVCSFEDNCLIIDSTNINKSAVREDLMREMRSSSLFLGSVLGRMNEAVISSPGGCDLGPRPIDIHIRSMRSLGADISERNGYIFFSAKNGLKGTYTVLPFPSVGATENTIVASVLARGKTVIENCAKEPEIVELADFLNKAGARITGAGSDRIVIEGVKKLRSVTFAVGFDRIVAATYISAAAVTGGDVLLCDVDTSKMRSVISVFEEAGCNFSYEENAIRVRCRDRLNSLSTVKSHVYPGFPTDAGPTLISALSVAKGTSIFIESIFENRYDFACELRRMGADVKIDGRTAVILGRENLYGARCVATDLRGGAALVVAGLSACGTTIIDRTDHIKRGYQDIVGDLAAVSADIKEI